MKTLTQIREAVRRASLGTDDYLVETSLSRIWQHVNSDHPFIMITAFRGGSDAPDILKRNIARNEQLASEIRSAGYGYTWIDGYWIENQGTPNEKHVAERSLFVVGDDRLLNLAKGWMHAFQQESILYKPAGKNQSVQLVSANGSTQDIGHFSPDKMAQAYSRLASGSRRPFVFESAAIDGGWLARVAAGWMRKRT